MARERINMKKIREIIRFKEISDMSERKIARALNISRPVVAQYIKDFNASGLTYEETKDMPDSKFLALFGHLDCSVLADSSCFASSRAIASLCHGGRKRHAHHQTDPAVLPMAFVESLGPTPQLPAHLHWLVLLVQACATPRRRLFPRQ